LPPLPSSIRNTQEFLLNASQEKCLAFHRIDSMNMTV
jgi:hypothetical protein